MTSIMKNQNTQLIDVNYVQTYFSFRSMIYLKVENETIIFTYRITK
ncbi:hypothetical protein VCRA2128O104_20284 [Vibrio crassostreae]|nr:hypothetical protein VCRA2128O104_20284 [Vibrio crassostreae]